MPEYFHAECRCRTTIRRSRTAPKVRAMTITTRALGGVLVLVAMTGVALCVAAPASAHVTVNADHTWRGGVAILTFEVPNESETGSATTQLSVTLPNVTSAHTEVMPGWTAQLQRETNAGIYHAVTWTAAPNAGIPPDQFALFRVEVTLPDSDTASFPATQTYADGKVVHWDQPPLPGGGEPEHPAPMLKLTKATAESADHTTAPAAQPAAQVSRPDDIARWLAGAGIVVGALGVALALVMRRRT
jgi:uncharacterized protein YcnI